MCLRNMAVKIIFLGASFLFDELKTFNFKHFLNHFKDEIKNKMTYYMLK